MDLGKVLEKLPQPQHENLLVGINTSDDAGVYKISDDLAVIQTVDFFTPIVDDPYMYGQISAANSLSDVYAMGGRPLTALNVVCFSTNIFSTDVLAEILKGGFDKVSEAGAVIVGGHTATDDELKYGLSVTGVIHPDKIVTNSGARPGDKLILTKPLGTGIISTALKFGKDLGELTDRVCRVMAELNKTASEVMQEIGVNACTDITGFGLLGHTYEMAAGAKVGINIQASDVPYFKEVIGLIEQGLIPGGTISNGAYLEDKVNMDKGVSSEQATVLFDAQTSGGLLISVEESKSNKLISELHNRGVQSAAIIGEVTAEHPAFIMVR
jgi:selenide,water dikinase